MIPLLCDSVRVEVRIGLKTPLFMSVLSSASMAGRAVAGSSLSARFAVMWKFNLSGGFLSLEGYLRTSIGGTVFGVVLSVSGSSIGSGGASVLVGSMCSSTAQYYTEHSTANRSA